MAAVNEVSGLEAVRSIRVLAAGYPPRPTSARTPRRPCQCRRRRSVRGRPRRRATSRPWPPTKPAGRHGPAARAFRPRSRSLGRRGAARPSDPHGESPSSRRSSGPAGRPGGFVAGEWYSPGPAIVVSGGRGANGAGNFAIIEALAVWGSTRRIRRRLEQGEDDALPSGAVLRRSCTDRPETILIGGRLDPHSRLVEVTYPFKGIVIKILSLRSHVLSAGAGRQSHPPRRHTPPLASRRRPWPRPPPGGSERTENRRPAPRRSATGTLAH